MRTRSSEQRPHALKEVTEPIGLRGRSPTTRGSWIRRSLAGFFEGCKAVRLGREVGLGDIPRGRPSLIFHLCIQIVRGVVWIDSMLGFVSHDCISPKTAACRPRVKL